MISLAFLLNKKNEKFVSFRKSITSLFFISVILAVYSTGCGAEKKIIIPQKEISINDIYSDIESGNLSSEILDKIISIEAQEQDKLKLLSLYYGKLAENEKKNGDVESYLAIIISSLKYNNNRAAYRTALNIIYNEFFLRQKYELSVYYLNQLENFFPDNKEILEAKAYSYYYLQNIYELELLVKKYEDKKNFSPEFLKFIGGIKNELSDEFNFYQYSIPNFQIFYSHQVDYDTIMLIANNLSSAVDYCNNLFHWLPDNRITVIVYSQSEYRKFVRIPEWSSGFFDGKIRIPVISGNSPQYSLKSTVFHEYTHALQYQKTSGNLINYWFAEGLAKYVECSGLNFNYKPSGEYILAKDINSVFINNKSEFNKISSAYFQSYYIMKNVIDRYGAIAITNIIQNFNKNRNINRAFEKEIFLTPEQLFERLEYEIKELYRSSGLL